MKKIITLITIIASCIWAFDVKNLSDCTVSKKHDSGIGFIWEHFEIKCNSPVEYGIEIDITNHELVTSSEYVYTNDSKKTDRIYFDSDGDAHHEISEQDEYDVYVSMNDQIISTNKADKLLMKKWEYFKKLKKQIETN